ncbi:MAG TPA: class I SAM-dependent methyltransferase [Phycisphaerales bacterium]|nr:class I SAM-dependent methyltransferase [Phycisphaerales bacterium]
MALHELNPTGRFSDRGREYARYRPSYPAAAIDAVVRAVELVRGAGGGGREIIAADVGAGTGISSRLLTERGVRVMAVEPNAGMRDSAEPHARVSWIDGSAERTGLDAQSVDLVLCAQAFHWFDESKALAEFHRVLKERGVLSLVWNDRDNSDPLTGAYGRAILEASGNHPAALDRSECGQAVFGSPLFRGAQVQAFAYEQPMDLDGLIGRALSASYTPKAGPAHEKLVRELREAHAAFADAEGVVRMRYRTRVYTAVRADAA